MDTITITIPGVCYYEAFDPLASGMAGEIGLPEPESRKVGRGLRFTYRDITLDQAREVAEHLGAMGALWLNNTGPYESAERSRYHTMIRTGERLSLQIAKAAR